MPKKNLDVVLRGKDENLQKTLNSVEKKLAKTGSLIRTLGRTVLATFSARKISTGIRAGVAAFADLEKIITRANAFAEGGNDTFQSLFDKAREMGRTTVKTPIDAANALKELTQAGFSAEQAMAGVGEAIRVSVIGEQEDVGRAAKQVARIMESQKFERTAGNFSEVVDVLSVASTKAQTDLSSLAEAFTFVGPIAKQSGMNFTTTVAALMQLSNTIGPGEKAGTALRQILIKMAGPTEKARKKWQELGIELGTTEGNFRALTSILGSMGDEFKALGDQEKLGALSELFEARAGAGTAGLLVGTEKMKEWIELLKNAKGKGKALEEELRNNLAGSVTLLNSKLNDLLITLGSKFAPVVTRLVRFLNENFDAISQFVDDMVESFIQSIPDVAKVIGNVVVFIAKAVDRVMDIMNWLWTNWQTIIHNIKTVWTNMWANLPEVIKAVGPLILATLKSVFLQITHSLSQFGEDIGLHDMLAQQGLGQGDARKQFNQLNKLRVKSGKAPLSEYEFQLSKHEALRSVGDSRRTSNERALAGARSHLDAQVATMGKLLGEGLKELVTPEGFGQDSKTTRFIKDTAADLHEFVKQAVTEPTKKGIKNFQGGKISLDQGSEGIGGIKQAMVAATMPLAAKLPNLFEGSLLTGAFLPQMDPMQRELQQQTKTLRAIQAATEAAAASARSFGIPAIVAGVFQ